MITVMAAAAIPITVGTLAPEMRWRGRRKVVLSVVDDTSGEEWLDAQCVADLAGVNRSTVWRADPEDLPYEAIGGSRLRGGDRRYRMVDAERWRDRRRKPVKSRLAAVEDQLEDLAARVDRIEHNLRDGPGSGRSG